MRTILIVSLLVLLPIYGICQITTDSVYSDLKMAERSNMPVNRISINSPLTQMGLKTLENFTELTYLNLSNQHLDSFQIDFSKFTKLEKLLLCNNRLKVFPEGIKHLNNLDSIIIYNNQISILPEWIGRITQLKTIGITGNRISIVPDSFFTLREIENFYSGFNNLKRIDTRLLKMPRIREIFMASEQINSLPQNFSVSKSLSLIVLDDNPLTWQQLVNFKNKLPSKVWLIHNEHKNPFFYTDPNTCNSKDTSRIGHIFRRYEVLPDFKGGTIKHQKFLTTKLSYSIFENRETLFDSATVHFVIFQKGGISKINVLDATDENLAIESVRLTELSCQYFEPALTGSRYIDAYATLRYYFRKENRNDKGKVWAKFIL